MRPTTTYFALTAAVVFRLRRLAGLQQLEVGHRVGVNQSSWSKLERGITAISIEYLAILAPVLGAEPGAVLMMVDRVARYAEAQGVRVLRKRADLVGEALKGELGTEDLAALIEAALQDGQAVPPTASSSP